MREGLIGDIRRGESHSLVPWGEAGIGKTALLEYLVESADLDRPTDRGVESEMDHHRVPAYHVAAQLARRRPASPTRSAWLQQRQRGCLQAQPCAGLVPRDTVASACLGRLARSSPNSSARRCAQRRGHAGEPVDQLADFGQPRAKVGVADFDRHPRVLQRDEFGVGARDRSNAVLDEAPDAG